MATSTTPLHRRSSRRNLALAALVLLTVVTSSGCLSACQNDEPRPCFDNALKTGERISILLATRRSPREVSASGSRDCATEIGMTTGTKLYADVDAPFRSSCQGFFVRLVPPLFAIPAVTWSASRGGDASDVNAQLLGSETFFDGSTCGGSLDFTISFPTEPPIAVPYMPLSGAGTPAEMKLALIAVSTVDASVNGCPQSCNAVIDVQIQRVDRSDGGGDAGP